METKYIGIVVCQTILQEVIHIAHVKPLVQQRTGCLTQLMMSVYLPWKAMKTANRCTASEQPAI
jgi:hypothetical protein